MVEPVGRSSLSEAGRDLLRAVIDGKGMALWKLMWGGSVGGGGVCKWPSSVRSLPWEGGGGGRGGGEWGGGGVVKDK